jgi:hypothetical protein
MKVSHLFEAPGRVHTIRNPNIKPMGAPAEKARAFDDGPTDRSALAKLAKAETTFSFGDNSHTEWYPPESEVSIYGAPYVEVAVKNEAGARFMVVFDLKRDKIELTGDVEVRGVGGQGADKQAEKYEKELTQFVLDAFKKGTHIEGVYNGLDKNGHFTQGKMPGV